MFYKKLSHSLAVVLFAALSLCSVSAFADGAFELAGVSTPVGEKNTFFATEGDIALPVTVVHGNKPGPVLLLTAGIHGDEFPSMLALQKLGKELRADTLKGTVVIVHLANLDGFHEHRLALNPRDEKNLNREFPGDKAGTSTEQISEFLTREFIARCDFLVDMHSGSANQKLLNHVYSPFVGDAKLDALTFEFAKATGMQHIVMYGERPRDPQNSISYPNTAMTRGKPGLTTEIGHLGQRDDVFVEQALTVAKNALRFLDMIAGDATPHPEPAIYQKVKYLDSHNDGFFTPLVTIGDVVQPGTVLGEVSDYFGNKVEDITAPDAGIVMMINETPPIRSGESAVAIGIRQ
ncbi:succinylglutamate desuccinylase/aspartoacylase family protein [Alteromonas gilva]|uniref:M14 family metallopeptidase n=1 Tax=Alteromonas gilva TaxID=2987522 RepID=A0ABT5L4I3_9ALTE|nr:M14 family metallopeptidase [Alteromonas gilva]MDC8831957.1 M14 family metallopeptidase [Alteromonas gilva]